jgi:hypothetical protein
LSWKTTDRIQSHGKLHGKQNCYNNRTICRMLTQNDRAYLCKEDLQLKEKNPKVANALRR